MKKLIKRYLFPDKYILFSTDRGETYYYIGNSTWTRDRTKAKLLSSIPDWYTACHIEKITWFQWKKELIVNFFRLI